MQPQQQQQQPQQQQQAQQQQQQRTQTQQQPAAAEQRREPQAGPSGSGNSGGGAPSVDPALAALGVRAPIAVFSQRAVEAAAAAARAAAAGGGGGGGAAAASDDPLPDEFFEFTADDFAEVARAQQRRAAAEAVLMTRTAREAQARARAERMPPVPVRLHFPDGSIVQADFRATQPLAAVLDLARAVAAPALAAALHLYTTPPKAVLRDAAATLFALQLYPAAHVHVGAAGESAAAAVAGGPLGSALRPEVAALMSDAVPAALAGRAEANAGGGAGGSAADADRERVLAEARRRAAAAAAGGRADGGDGGGERKVPKWLKR